jgi:hypothetical protein
MILHEWRRCLARGLRKHIPNDERKQEEKTLYGYKNI